MSEYDEAYQRGKQETAYNGSGRADDYAGWQQAQADKQRDAGRFRAPGSGGVPVPQGGGGGLFVLLAIAGVVTFWAYVLLALASLATVVLAAAIAAPCLRYVARLFGADHTGRYLPTFVLMLKALGAYAAVFLLLFTALWLLGKAAPDTFFDSFRHVGDAVATPLPMAYTFRFVPWLQIIGTVAFLQVPALLAFAFILRRNGVAFARAAHGLWKGMAAGAVIVTVFGSVATALVYHVWRML